MEVRGCCWNSEGIVVIIIVVIEAMLLLLLLSLTILVLTNRLLSRFFYPGTQRHTVWYSTCRLTLGFKEIRACLVFQFLYFLFSKLRKLLLLKKKKKNLENFFLKIIFETSFQNIIFTAFVFGSYFLKQVFKKRKPKLVFGSYF